MYENNKNIGAHDSVNKKKVIAVHSFTEVYVFVCACLSVCLLVFHCI